MARTINDFPAELLQLVLQKLKSEARIHRDDSFVNTLTTCRLWHQIGEEVLWTDINIISSQLASFCASTSSATTFTRTLSITIFPYRAEEERVLHPDDDWSSIESEDLRGKNNDHVAESAGVCRNLQDLSLKVQVMQRLESFSIRVQNKTDWPTHGFHLRSRELRTLLDALPTSVRHFELDDNCCWVEPSNWGPVPEEDHLCLSLKKLLPQLHNVRLRRGRVCEAMLAQEPACAELSSCRETSGGATNTFLINILGWDYDSGPTMRCSMSADAVQVMVKRKPSSDFLIPHLRSVVARGALSNFHLFSLIDVRTVWSSEGRGYPHILQRTLGLTEKSKKSPWWYSHEDKYPHSLRHLEANGSTSQIIGTIKEVVELTEDQVWVDTIEGYRLASSYIKSNRRFRHAKLQSLKVHNVDKVGGDYHCEYYFDGPLVKLERQEGRLLLLPEIMDGLDDGGPVHRSLTRKELPDEARKQAIEKGEEVEDELESESRNPFHSSVTSSALSNVNKDGGNDHDVQTAAPAFTCQCYSCMANRLSRRRWTAKEIQQGYLQ